MHLPHEIILNANLMQQGNFINVFLARHVSSTYAHHLEHGADGAVPQGTIRIVHTTYAAALKTIQKFGAENHLLQLNIQCS